MNGSKYSTEAIGFVSGPLSVVHRGRSTDWSLQRPVLARAMRADKGPWTTDEAVGERSWSDTSRTVRSGGGAKR